jgi:hypothetical protein
MAQQKKGDLGGFQEVMAKSPLTPLCERGEQEVAPLGKGEMAI